MFPQYLFQFLWANMIAHELLRCDVYRCFYLPKSWQILAEGGPQYDYLARETFMLIQPGINSATKSQTSSQISCWSSVYMSCLQFHRLFWWITLFLSASSSGTSQSSSAITELLFFTWLLGALQQSEGINSSVRMWAFRSLFFEKLLLHGQRFWAQMIPKEEFILFI